MSNEVKDSEPGQILSDEDLQDTVGGTRKHEHHHHHHVQYPSGAVAVPVAQAVPAQGFFYYFFPFARFSPSGS